MNADQRRFFDSLTKRVLGAVFEERLAGVVSHKLAGLLPKIRANQR